MDIIVPDKFEHLYALEKANDPSKRFLLRSYKKSLVEGVDRLVELSRGKETCRLESDWMVMTELISFFIKEWPQEWKHFIASVPEIRESRRDGGYSESREIKFVAALPPRLEKLIKTIFPLQPFDKRFIYSLIKKYKVFKIGGENNLGKGKIIV